MIVHLSLGRNDKDLIAWKKALPKMTFSWYVREIIRADRKGKILELPLETEEVMDGEVYETKLYFTGKEEIVFIRTVTNGKRNKRIKEVIRHHLEQNRRYIAVQKARDEVTSARDSEVAVNTSNDDMSDEYKEMLRRMSGK